MRRAGMIRGPLGVALGLIAAAAGCSSKSSAGAPGQSSAEASAAEHRAPRTCPAGNAIRDGACASVVTPQQIAAVARLPARLDELARLLDRVDVLRAPIELLGDIRRLEPAQAPEASAGKLAAPDAVAGALDQAVQALRAFQDSLGEASARLANLRGDLDRVMADTGEPRRIEEVRARISPEVRAALEPLAVQVKDAIQRAIAPLLARLPDLSAAVTAGCTTARLSGGGEKRKELCAQARDALGKAVAYLAEVEDQPAKLLDAITSELLAALDPLIDAGTRKLLEAAQARVDEAPRLSPASSGSASGSGGERPSR